MELEFAKVCYADNKKDMELGRLQYLGDCEFALTACQPAAADDFGKGGASRLTLTITGLLPGHPMAGKGLALIRAFAGRLKKWPTLRGFALFRSVR